MRRKLYNYGICCAVACIVIAAAAISFFGTVNGGFAIMSAVPLNFTAAPADAMWIGIIAGAIVVVLIGVTIAVWITVTSRRKKAEKRLRVKGNGAIEDELGKLTLELANAVYRASGKNAAPSHYSGSKSEAHAPIMPITLVMNSPAPAPQPTALPYQPLAQQPTAGFSSAGYVDSRDAAEQFQPKKSITEYDFARKLSRKAFYAAMRTYLTDDMIIERVYEEVYLPRRYTRKRLFRDKGLVRDLIRKEKRRVYKIYKGGLSIVDACKTRFDLEREAELSKSCNLEYICGFNVDTVEIADDINTLKERRSLLLQIQKDTSEEIKANVEKSIAIRRDERYNLRELETKKADAKLASRQGKHALYPEIEQLSNLIYENDKVGDEAERVVHYKNALLAETNKALKVLETVIIYMESSPVSLRVREADVPSINARQNEYDVIAGEIEDLERERYIVEAHLKAVIEKMGAEGSGASDRLAIRCDELSEKLGLLDARLESLRKKSINKIIMDGNAAAPQSAPMTKKSEEVMFLRSQLRYIESENEAIEILSRLYAMRNGLTADERSDRTLVALVQKAIKESMQAAELNKYMRILRAYREDAENKRKELPSSIGFDGFK